MHPTTITNRRTAVFFEPKPASAGLTKISPDLQVGDMRQPVGRYLVSAILGSANFIAQVAPLTQGRGETANSRGR